jgi:hypothetical protein
VATSIQVVIDCADPQNLSRFWAEALGYILQPPPQGFASWEEFLTARNVPEDQWNSRSAVVDLEGNEPRFFFQRVPEHKTVKNRVHVDLNIGGPPDAPPDERRRRIRAEVQRLQGIGATIFREMDEMGEHWVVMQDPEGNEFCVH